MSDIKADVIGANFLFGVRHCIVRTFNMAINVEVVVTVFL